MAEDKKTRREWERRFPSLNDEWALWWIEGDGALLAVVGGADLAVALDIVDKHHDQCAHIVAHVAKVDSFGEVVRDEGRGCVIVGRDEVPPGDRKPLEETRCCFCGRVLGGASDAITLIQRPA